MNFEQFQDLYNSTNLGAKATSYLYAKLCERTKCFMCKTKYPEGVIRKMPGVLKSSVRAVEWFTDDFLFHMAATHGYNKQDLDMMLENIAEMGDLT